MLRAQPGTGWKIPSQEIQIEINEKAFFWANFMFCIFKEKMTEIRPFQTETQLEKRLHQVEIRDGRPIPSIQYINKQHDVPKELIKYYKADKNGYKVLKDEKIWASNPINFNDPFDCSIQMWDKDNFPIDFAKQHLEITKDELKKSGIILKEISSSDESVRKNYFDLILKYIGVFCLNDNKNSDLFWGYYNNHEGFSIVFDSAALSRYWRMKPLNVEYDDIENFKKISLIPKELENYKIFPKIIRWSTLKKCEWSHETEWRFIFLDIDILERNRLKNYPANSVVEVVLGYKFFVEQVKGLRDTRPTNNTRTFEFLPQDNQYKLYILSELHEKGIDVYHIELSEDFELIQRKIEILEIKNSKVTMFYSDITKK